MAIRAGATLFQSPADVSIGSPKNHTDNTNMAEAIASQPVGLLVAS